MTQVEKSDFLKGVLTSSKARSVRGGRLAKSSRGVVSFGPAVVAGGIALMSGTVSANAQACPAPVGGPLDTEMCDLGVFEDSTPNSDRSLAFGVSGDGSVVVGEAQRDFFNLAMRWTAEDGMKNLGALPGHERSTAFGVSDDGAVVVGVSTKAGSATAFRWTQALGMVALDFGPYAEASAAAVNADGTVIVGYATGNRLQRSAVRWEGGTLSALGTLSGFNLSEATAVNGSGSVVVGFAQNGSSGATSAFRWRSSDGMTSLGIIGFTDSRAYGISANGSVIVGDMVGISRVGFRWTDTGLTELNPLAGDLASSALAISGDGKVAVGSSRSTNLFNSLGTAVMWSENGDVTSLGTLTGGNNSKAQAVNFDGTVIVGTSNTGTNIADGLFLEDALDRAFIWRGGAMQDFSNLMASFPVLANDTDLAVSTQEWSLGKVLDQTAFVGVEGGNYFAVGAGASNAGSGALSDSQSNQVADLTFGRGISAELTVGASLQMSGASNAASDFDTDTGTSVSIFAEYSKGGADRTGLQASLALGYAAAGNTITRGQAFADVEAATGNGDLETMAARVAIGYGIDHASGWLLTPHAAISQYSTSRGAYAEDPTATAFSAAYDELNVETTVGTAGIVGEQKLNETSSFSLGAGADFDINAEATVLTGSANIPGMETFGVTSGLVRNDVRPFATADYSIDLAEGGTVTATARLGKAVYGSEADLGVGIRYGISF